MCFALPQKITQIKGNQAKSEQGDTLDSSLVSVKKGDWILKQNSLIIGKLSTKQARNIFRLIKHLKYQAESK